jgi:hypothetical protein
VNTQSGLAILLFLSAPALTTAAELKQETAKAWDEYTQAATSRMQERVKPDAHFLWSDESPERNQKVRRGDILVSQVGRGPKSVPSGLIHDWIGAAFIPNTNLHQVFDVLNSYDRYKEIYRPMVVDAKLLEHSGPEYKFSMLWLHKVMMVTAALDSQYESRYIQVDPNRWYSVAYSTRVQEIEHYGQTDEHKLPPDEGSGYIWRMYSIARYEQRDGGVYAEMEAMVLTREIPPSFRWLVDPIVRRLSRNSMITSLHQTRQAVLSKVQTAGTPPRKTGVESNFR